MEGLNYNELFESEISTTHKSKGKLFESEKYPDKIIRVESFEALERRYKGQISPESIVEMGQKLYQELNDQYNIIVPVEYYIGQDSFGNSVVYGITEKIKGENLAKVEVRGETVEELENLYKNISKYYLDKIQTEEPYLADINGLTQYVYGKKKNEESRHIYLIDTDLYIRDGKVALYNVILWLVRHLIGIEERFDHKLVGARKNIESILALPLPQNLSPQKIEIIQRIKDNILGYLHNPDYSSQDAHPLFSDL